MDNLFEICNFYGCSGDEQNVADYIIKKIYNNCDRIYKDNMGNVYAYKNGTAPARKLIMLCSHMDEVGFIISSVTDDGYLKFRTIGGIDENVLLAKRILIGENKISGVIGVKAVHLMTKEQRKQKLKLEDMYIDIGALSKAEAESMVQPGEYAYFDTVSQKMGDLMLAKATDDRIGCAILCKLADNTYENDICFCFTVQEEIGLRGASLASKYVKPDVCVVVENTTCLDMPEVPHNKISTAVGNGPAITILDRTTYADKKLCEALTECSQKYQYKNVAAGGNDAGSIHLNGIRTAAISIPSRYIHSPVCVVSPEDITECIKTLSEFLKRGEMLC